MLFLPLVDEPLPPRATDFPIQVYRDSLPERPYKEVAKLNVHMEKTHLLPSAFTTARRQLENQARACGAEGIIKIVEDRSRLNETLIYNVSAVAIVFTD